MFWWFAVFVLILACNLLITGKLDESERRTNFSGYLI